MYYSIFMPKKQYVRAASNSPNSYKTLSQTSRKGTPQDTLPSQLSALSTYKFQNNSYRFYAAEIVRENSLQKQRALHKP